jgi:hypothetical protein
MANDLSLPVEKRTENIEKLKAIVLDQDNDSLNKSEFVQGCKWGTTILVIEQTIRQSNLF